MNDYRRIAEVIRYLDQHHTEQPELAALADHVGLSPFHFHRLFANWAAITPKDFLQCLTVSHAKQLLRDGHSALEVALHAGLSGAGRLHDLCVTLEAASPGELKSGGAGLIIIYGFADSPFGRCLIGETGRGVCHLSFVDSSSEHDELAALEKCWPQARFQRDDAAAGRLADRVFTRSNDAIEQRPLRAFVGGTAFQVQVWRALLHVPQGSLVSYGHLAAAVGKSGASRAVGTAVGRNSIAYLIPCHRVIRETGVIGDYRWGRDRKRAMLAWESEAATAAIQAKNRGRRPLPQQRGS